MDLQKPSRSPGVEAGIMEPLCLRRCPPPRHPLPFPSLWHNTRKHRTASRTCQQQSQRSLLAPRTLIQPCCGGHSGTQVRKTCFLQQNKKSSVGQDGGDIVPFWSHPLRPVEVLGRSGCSSPSPTRTCGSCSVGCGARCCVSAGAASIPWSRGPVPLASWRGPRSSGTA